MTTEELFVHVKGLLQHRGFWVGAKTNSGPIIKAHILGPKKLRVDVDFDLLVGPLSAPEHWEVGDLGIFGHDLRVVLLHLEVLRPQVRVAVFRNDDIPEYHLEVVLSRSVGAEAVLAKLLNIHTLAPGALARLIGGLNGLQQSAVVPNYVVRLTMSGIRVAFTPQQGVVVPDGGFVTSINAHDPVCGMNYSSALLVFAGDRYIVSNLHTW